jgi:hypothetical protein
VECRFRTWLAACFVPPKQTLNDNKIQRETPEPGPRDACNASIQIENHQPLIRNRCQTLVLNLDTEPMAIKIQVTKQDWVRFRLFDVHRRSSARFRWLAGLVLPPLLILAASIGALAVLGMRPIALLTTLAPASLVTVLYWVLFTQIEKRRAGQQFDMLAKSSREQFLSGEIDIDVSEEGVTAVSGSARNSWRWQQLHSVVSNEDYGYIYLYPGRALIIPRHSFPDAEAFRVFIKMAVIFHWNKESNGRNQDSKQQPALQGT